MSEDNGKNGKGRMIRPPCIETTLIVKRLKDLQQGDTVVWDELDKAAMIDVREVKPYAWSSAKRILLRDHRKNFKPYGRGQGVKCLTDPEAIDDTKDTVKRSRRMFKRDLFRMAVVDYGRLNSDERTAYNTQISVLGTLTQATSRKTLAKVEKQVKQVNEQLMIEKTLELFKN